MYVLGDLKVARNTAVQNDINLEVPEDQKHVVS